jgi:RNA polymerase sigma-70 factor (family 1)
MQLYQNYTDAELLSFLRNGDEAAFTEIYDRYWKSLYQAAYKRLSDRERAEDVLQDVFARLWVRRQERQIDHLGAYLASAVRYEVIRHINRNPSALFFYQPLEEMLLEIESPEGKLLAKEIVELTYAYGKTLPEKRRKIFFLHIESKLSTSEIADRLGISTKTVQNQLGTALAGLKTHLAPVILAILSTRF